MRRYYLTVVSPLGSKKGPHVHLSSEGVISVLPPPTCFWSGVVLGWAVLEQSKHAPFEERGILFGYIKGLSVYHYAQALELDVT